MMVLGMLDGDSSRHEGLRGTPWFDGLEDSLGSRPAEWLSDVAEVEELDDERAWALLSWIEAAASQIVRTRAKTTLDVAIFGMALLVKSRLDWRDVSVVGALLHRAAILAALRYEISVVDGCAAAGSLGEAAFPRLIRMDSATPPTHVELGSGDAFVFERRPPEFDVADLERWLEGESK
jgi:hypothetical protein